MPKFTFKARDGNGRIRTGKVQAESIVTVRRLLADKGLELIDAEDADSSLSFLAEPSPKFRGLSFAPPDQNQYRPTPLERLVSMLANDGWSRILVAGLALLGLGVFLWNWKNSEKKALPLRPATVATPTTLRVKIGGTLTRSSSLSDDVNLVLDLPEIPFRKVTPLHDILQSGTYTLTLDLISHRQPRRGQLFLSREGRPISETVNVALTGQPLTGQAPEIKLSRNY